MNYNVGDKLICIKDYIVFEKDKIYEIENIRNSNHYKLKGVNPYFSLGMINKYFKLYSEEK